MTRLMKASDTAGQSTVCFFRTPITRPPAQRSDPAPGSDLENAGVSPEPAREHDYMHQKVALLENEIEQLREQLQTASKEAEAIEGEAYERGRDAGEREALAQDGKRIALLSDNLAQAREHFADSRSEMEALALAIAETAVEKVLGACSDRSKMIGDAIAVQMKRLNGELVLFAQVSAEDFPDDAQLDKLKARLPQLEVEARAGLASGECRMNLKLGQLDLGIPRQWSNIRTLFAELAQDRTDAS